MYLTLAFILIGVGILLLLAEIIFPSGMLLAVSVAAIAIGVALTFSQDTNTGLITLAALLAAAVVVGVLLPYWWQTPFGRRLLLPGPEEDTTLASMPVNQELEQLVGRVGRTISDLRPSGVTDFDGRRIDTITEGLMVDAGQWVRCIAVRAGRVVVRPVEKPDLTTLETADFS
jgi:membrane-bound serine protease (ClpP class)